MVTPQASRIAKIQRVQDFMFHAVTQFFALSVLIVLVAILISLFMNAWPALHEFGPGFFFTEEWDIVNGEFGGLIAIYGTLVTSLV